MNQRFPNRRHAFLAVYFILLTWLLLPLNAGAQGPGARARGGGYGASSAGEASFQIDPVTGSLIVITDDETNEMIGKLISSLDMPIQQVLIKVLFLEVTHSDGLDIGVEAAFRGGTSRVDDPSTTDVVENTLQFEDTVGTLFGLATESEGAFYQVLKDDFELTLRALAEVGKLEVLSRPSILARNNETAVITLGQEVPFIRNSRITDDGDTINTVEYEDIGIILEVTPHITADGLVEMEVAPEISTLTGDTVKISDTVNAPVIAKRAAETQVIVPDGMTVVIGGLMEDNETETVRKVPILGDIPWLGAAFRRTIKSKAKTELLIFLTPQVVRETQDLKDLTVAESRNTRLVPEAFDQAEMDQFLEGEETLIEAAMQPEERPGPMTRCWRWFRASILRLR